MAHIELQGVEGVYGPCSLLVPIVIDGHDEASVALVCNRLIWSDQILARFEQMVTSHRAKDSRMRVLLIGAPGSGKGTQAVLLAEHLRVPHISSGELLREHMARGTAEGKQAAVYVNRGDLVPDELVQDMLREPVRQAAERGGYILDGFPRTVCQAMSVQLDAENSLFAVQAAVYLAVANEELTRRLLARGRGVDDTRAVIEHRLRVFDEHTTPMLAFFGDRGELVEVNGARPVPEVTWSIEVQLQRIQRRKASV